jgi:hypothetical protein
LLPCWGFTNFVAMLGFHKLCCHVGISQIMLPCFH